MQRFKVGPIFLAVLASIGLSPTLVAAMYHHVDDCAVCHYADLDPLNCAASPNLVLIRDEIETPNSGSRPTVFGPYVTGEPLHNGVCEVCHTGTNYYRNDSTGSHPEYKSGSMGPTDCNVCHLHVPFEFGHEGAVGTGCDTCHGQEGGAGTAFSHATHTEGTVPRGPAAAMDCGECHDTDNFPYFTDSATTLDATTACAECHSEGGGYNGVAMAKAGWKDGIYEEDGEGNVTLKPGQDAWCIGCHDDESPTIEDRTAKQVSGDNRTYGYDISGHGKYDIGCADCHDPQFNHIDAYDRTYDEDSSAVDWPNNIDGARGYQQGYRLKSVNETRPLLIPRREIGWDGDPEDFALCFSCHSAEQVCVSAENNFIEINALMSQSDFDNHHVQGSQSYHIANLTYYCWDSDRDAESVPNGRDSNFSCPACHDPHGKKAYDKRATWSMTRGDMGIVHKREVMRSYGYLSSVEYALAGGDLNCDHCHPGGNLGYTFQLGTPPPKEPAFWTQLDNDESITTPRFGVGGMNQGATFASYTRLGASETGLKIDDGDTEASASFPISNLNGNNATEGETIDFWYTPNFTPAYNSGEQVLFHCFSDDQNYIKIQMYNNTLVFVIRSEDSTYYLQAINFMSSGGWQANNPHHVVCTWGPAFGMHIYLDKIEPEYHANSTGTDYIGGMTQFPAPPNDHFYIGNTDPRSTEGDKPAEGIIDDFKIFGYQYQRYLNSLAFFSKMGSQDEIENPVSGFGGNVEGNVDYSDGVAQHGKSVEFGDPAFPKGRVNFPTSNLNSNSDSIDFWYYPAEETSHPKLLFYCEKDGDNKAVIRMLTNRAIEFEIVKGGAIHRLKTEPMPKGFLDYPYETWNHIVCTWGEGGMHIYINDREATYEIKNGLTYYDGLWDFGAPPGTPAYFQIGRVAVNDDEHADGYIDELRIYGYQADKPELEFVYTPLGYNVDLITISGQVGTLGDVTMNGLPGNPKTKNGYYYAIVEDGWTGTVQPVKDGYSFDPVSISYNDPVYSSVPNQNYTPSGVNLEIPIEMIDLGISSNLGTATTYTRSAIKLDEADYDGDMDYYFEVVAKNTNPTLYYTVDLIDITNSAIQCSLTVPSNTNVATRFRTPAFIPASGNNEYRIRLPGTAAAGQLAVYTARVVVVQAYATRTRIQIPLLTGPAYYVSNSISQGTDATSSSDYGQTYADHYSLWKKDLSVWGDVAAGTPWTFEAVFGTTHQDATGYVSLFNKTDDTQVAETELSHGYAFGVETVDFATDAVDFDDLDQFEVRHRVTDTDPGNDYESRICRAALYVKLTNLNKGEVYWRLARQAESTSSAINSAQRVLLNTDHYSNPSVYHESTGKDSVLGTITIGVWDAQTSDYSTSGSGVPSAAIDFSSTTKSLVRTATDLIFDLTSGNRYLAGINATDGTIVVNSSSLVVTFSELP